MIITDGMDCEPGELQWNCATVYAFDFVGEFCILRNAYAQYVGELRSNWNQPTYMANILFRNEIYLVIEQTQK